MHKLRSTYYVLGRRIRFRDSVDDWKDWAIEMLEAGYESDELIILAGLLPATNRFEYDPFVDKCLSEFELTGFSKEEILDGFIYHLICLVIDKKFTVLRGVSEMRDLYIELDYRHDLASFYHLSLAKTELDECGQQWYFDQDMNNENFESYAYDLFLRKKLDLESNRKLKK